MTPVAFKRRRWNDGPRGVPPLNAADGPDTRTESLGAREFDGVKAEGIRTTVIIPAGAIGNAAPIEIVSERWYSPELQTVLLSRRSDPRFGETTYRLDNIVRADPAPELFQVPSDFTIEQGGMSYGASVEKRIIRTAPAPAR